MKVIIDPGHGGSDSGAVAFGTTEKQLNLIFAKLLAAKLEQLKISVDRSLITDKYHDSRQLTDAIKNSHASLCISCHNNASGGKARGLEVIHSIHSKGTLAAYIIDEVGKTGYPVRKAFSKESTNPANAGKDYYFVIRLTNPQVETIIVEFGFMDNLEDYKMLINPTWQDKLTSAVAAAVKRYAPYENRVKTQIPGKSILTAEQLKRVLRDNNAGANLGIVDFYYKIAGIYGIKADLAFLQAMVETGWLKFGGSVKKEQNNFAGLGAVGGNTSDSFPTVEAGVEAHIQHLFSYCSTSPLPAGRKLLDKRFNLVKRGSAPNWEDLDGRWAVPGTGYGEDIVRLQKKIFEKYPPASTSLPPAPPAKPQPQAHWAKQCNDELLEAGLLNSDHTDSLDKPATEGMVICLINRLRKEFDKNA